MTMDIHQMSHVLDVVHRGTTAPWSCTLTSVERLWLDLSKADATAQPVEQVKHRYQKVLDNVSSKDSVIPMDPALLSLVRAHCLRSLAAAVESVNGAGLEESLAMTRQALTELDTARAKRSNSTLVYPWRSPYVFQDAVEYQTTRSYHQMGRCLIQLG